MTNQTTIGGVTLRCAEDGTLHIYQPDSNRNLSAELANKLTCWLLNNVDVDMAPHEADATDQATVPAGVINTSAGPALTALAEQAEADNLTALREEFGDEVRPPAPKRRGRPPRNPRA